MGFIYVIGVGFISFNGLILAFTPRYHIFAPSSAYVICPSAMTDGAASLLARTLSSPSREVFQSAYQHLTSRNPREAWTSGQWMTERSGGSDVSGTETVAILTPQPSNSQGIDGAPLGPWSISGFK